MPAVASSRCNNRISRSTGSTLNQARLPVSQLLRRASRSCSLNVRPSDMGRSSLSLLFGTQRPGSPPCESLRLLVCCRFLSGGGVIAPTPTPATTAASKYNNRGIECLPYPSGKATEGHGVLLLQHSVPVPVPRTCLPGVHQKTSPSPLAPACLSTLINN